MAALISGAELLQFLPRRVTLHFTGPPHVSQLPVPQQPPAPMPTLPLHSTTALFTDISQEMSTNNWHLPRPFNNSPGLVLLGGVIHYIRITMCAPLPATAISWLCWRVLWPSTLIPGLKWSTSIHYIHKCKGRTNKSITEQSWIQSVHWKRQATIQEGCSSSHLLICSGGL